MQPSDRQIRPAGEIEAHAGVPGLERPWHAHPKNPLVRANAGTQFLWRNSMVICAAMTLKRRLHLVWFPAFAGMSG
jgi:hypothetical protein